MVLHVASCLNTSLSSPNMERARRRMKPLFAFGRRPDSVAISKRKRNLSSVGTGGCPRMAASMSRRRDGCSSRPRAMAMPSTGQSSANRKASCGDTMSPQAMRMESGRHSRATRKRFHPSATGWYISRTVRKWTKTISGFAERTAAAICGNSSGLSKPIRNLTLNGRSPTASRMASNVRAIHSGSRNRAPPLWFPMTVGLGHAQFKSAQMAPAASMRFAVPARKSVFVPIICAMTGSR